MAFLLVALGFDHTVHKRALRAGAPEPASKLVAWVSLTMWMLVIGGGIFIGFVNGPE